MLTSQLPLDDATLIKPERTSSWRILVHLSQD
jgi:hypothetical protein